MQRLAGMVYYLAKCLPGLSDDMKSIYHLTNKDVEWGWRKEHDDAFTTVKTLVADATVLDIQRDASKTGLGTVLMQDGKPIPFSRRALTPTETRYAQIEKKKYLP